MKSFGAWWFTAWVISAGAVLALGCNAHIAKFDPSARFVCPGQKVDITWEFTGSGHMSALPPVAGVPEGTVAPSGRMSIYPVQKTRVSLRVTRCTGEPTGADIDIDTPAPVRVAADLNDKPVCTGKVLSLTTHLKAFASGVRAAVIGVEPAETRSFDISRVDAAGKTITGHVGPGVWTNAFAGLPMEGDWTLSTPLTTAESCTPPAVLPHVLTVFAYTSCSRGNP